MKTQYTVKLHTKEITKDKQKFFASSAEINGVWYKIKFVKDVKEAPTSKGLYELTIDFDNCSLEKGATYVSKKTGEIVAGNATIWVRKIEAIRKFTEEELKAENRIVFNEIFEGSEE